MKYCWAGVTDMGVVSHFLDSGAFTIKKKAIAWSKSTKRPETEYYRQGEFKTYLDDYAAFVKKYKVGIDLFANVDAIPHPETTWRNQCYLEKKHGIKPIPVVHYGTDLKWLRHYFYKGYDLIGLGGLVGKHGQEDCRAWIDSCFREIGDENGLPRVKLHGFGLTSYSLMRRYPWWSVDSSSWNKTAAFGAILVPSLKDGKFNFDKRPMKVNTSRQSWVKNDPMHILSIMVDSGAFLRRDAIQLWLDKVGMTVDELADEYQARTISCIKYYDMFAKSLPEWPWAFTIRKKASFR